MISSEIRLTEDKNIEMSIGQSVNISLASNPTTGYQWSIVEERNDNIVIQDPEHEYVPDNNSEKLVGSGGTQIFHIKAENKGTALLFFEYSRPWETQPPAMKISLKIDVV
ncbi:MAG: protease inhibitor I42 family protein [Candidatus Omnitrophica bacterium]|nr:protease inhibitor I42 family protein [Candidatus Omnitrophota bacterium]